MTYRLLISHPARPSKRAAKFPAWADVAEVPLPLLGCSFGQLVMAVSYITDVEPLVRAPPALPHEASVKAVAEAVARAGGVGTSTIDSDTSGSQGGDGQGSSRGAPAPVAVTATVTAAESAGRSSAGGGGIPSYPGGEGTGVTGSGSQSQSQSQSGSGSGSGSGGGDSGIGAARARGISVSGTRVIEGYVARSVEATETGPGGRRALDRTGTHDQSDATGSAPVPIPGARRRNSSIVGNWAGTVVGLVASAAGGAQSAVPFSTSSDWKHPGRAAVDVAPKHAPIGSLVPDAAGWAAGGSGSAAGGAIPQSLGQAMSLPHSAGSRGAIPGGVSFGAMARQSLESSAEKAQGTRRGTTGYEGTSRVGIRARLGDIDSGGGIGGGAGASDSLSGRSELTLGGNGGTDGTRRSSLGGASSASPRNTGNTHSDGHRRGRSGSIPVEQRTPVLTSLDRSNSGLGVMAPNQSASGLSGSGSGSDQSDAGSERATTRGPQHEGNEDEDEDEDDDHLEKPALAALVPGIAGVAGSRATPRGGGRRFSQDLDSESDAIRMGASHTAAGDEMGNGSGDH